MKKAFLTIGLAGCCLWLLGQESEGNFIKDRSTGCTVWFKHIFTEDSVTWSGACADGFAEGKGTMVGFTKGKETSRYVGEMKHGKPDGMGDFSFWGDRRLQGNFRAGEPLFLPESLLARLKRTVVSESDPMDAYVGDNNQKRLYYDIIVPEGKAAGAVILIPGTWTSTEYLLSSMSTFCELAFKHNIAVMALSLNQRLTLTDETLELMNVMISSAIQQFDLPKDKFVMGGWSMGGIFSMRYTEWANEDPKKTAIKPVAVINCDGPCDLEHVYNNFRLKVNKNPGQFEPAYGMRELEKYCGGTPESAQARYIHYSPYSRGVDRGGNAQYLVSTPIRIYADVDPVWWMENRHVDAYDLNALDQTAMIQLLNDMGNKEARFINAFQKGIRLEGNRHPHSWSIIEPHDCMDWILGILARK